MTAVTPPQPAGLGRARSRHRPGHAGTSLRRLSVVAEMTAAAGGVIAGYYLLINTARRLEARAVADLLHLVGVHQVSDALGKALIIVRPHGQVLIATLTPSCSSLMSVLALAALATAVLRKRRVHTLIAFLVATELLVISNVTRIAVSALLGIWFGKPALLLFHDWVGTVWNFAGTLCGFLLLVALTLPTAERAEQDRSGRHTARRPTGWGRSGLGYRVPALDSNRRPQRRTLTSVAVRRLLPPQVRRYLARHREAGRIDYRIGHLSVEQRAEAVVELARPGLGVHTASLLAVATYETEAVVLDALALAVVTRQWEPVSSARVASLRLWARGWLMSHPLVEDPGAVAVAVHPPTGDEGLAAPIGPTAGVAPTSSVTIDPQLDRPAPTGRTVAVTGAGGPAGVAVVRNLVAAGHRVIALDVDPLAVGLRLASVGMLVPSADDPAFEEALLEAIEASRAEALICTVAEEYPALTAASAALAAAGCRTWLPEMASVEMCNDKELFARCLSEAGVAHPPTAADPRAARRLPGPWIVKPRTGRGSRDVVRVDDAGQLAGVMASIPGAIAQSRLSGREFTADTLVGRDGRLLTCVPRWRVETKAGISVKGETFESEEVTQLVADALAAVGITGPANVQGFVDADGAVSVIEINPRFSGGLPLTLAAGADVVGSYLAGILDPDVAQPILAFEPGVRMLRYFADVFEETDTGRRLPDPASQLQLPAEFRALDPAVSPAGGTVNGTGRPPPGVETTGTSAETVYQRRLGVLAHAVLGKNVSETCRVFGISRNTFYRWRSQAARDGLDSFAPDEPGSTLEPVR